MWIARRCVPPLPPLRLSLLFRAAIADGGSESAGVSEGAATECGRYVAPPGSNLRHSRCRRNPFHFLFLAFRISYPPTPSSLPQRRGRDAPTSTTGARDVFAHANRGVRERGARDEAEEAEERGGKHARVAERLRAKADLYDELKSGGGGGYGSGGGGAGEADDECLVDFSKPSGGGGGGSGEEQVEITDEFGRSRVVDRRCGTGLIGRAGWGGYGRSCGD